MWDDAKAAIAASSKESSIYIGCDSIRYKKAGVWYARYTTVVVIHIDSCRGGKIFHRSVSEKDYGNLKTRLLMEVQMAVEAAEAILDVVGDRPLQIHLDINPDPNHKSNVAVKEALGWVRAMGFDAQVKPAAFAATYCADHMVRRAH